MRFSSSSSSLQFITTAKMSSSRAPYRGQNQWRRGLSDRPNNTADNYHRPVQHDDHGPNFRQFDGPDFRNSGGFHRQNFHQQPPPTFYQRPPPPRFHQPPPYQPQPLQFPQQPPFQQRQPPPFRRRPPPLNQGPLPVHQPRQFRPSNYKRPDYRNWEYALSQPPSECERFVVLSYNILADYLAINHRRELYWHIPHHILGWEWRKRKILFELGLWSPDIMSLQEVDRFQDLEEELKLHGYSGIWKMRTGIPVDGCAIFWRTTRFTLLYEESIEFNKLGLRDNVAQICVLESRCPKSADSKSDALAQQSSNDANRLVICNIHVLYNPRRGEMKLGQVRALLEKAYAVSKLYDDAPVVICGDFNCTGFVLLLPGMVRLETRPLIIHLKHLP